MKKIITIFSLLVIVSCTQNFTEINKNPNNPTTASESLLLPSAIFDLSNIIVNQTHNFGDVISQYGAYYEFNNLDIFRWQGDDRFWSPMYKILENLKDVKRIAKLNKNTNYEAISLIMESYVFSIVTDAYGDVPMSEANRTKEGIIEPIYDSQKDIYSNLFLKLEKANKIIDLSNTVKGDLLFSGDMLKWKKFANSLRIRLLMRISNVENISTRMSAIINNPSTYPLFESNLDNAVYNYTGSLPDIAPITAPGGGRGYDYYLLIPTTHLISTLTKNNDPRLEEWISPKVGTNDRTLGVAPGQSLSDIGRPADFSRRSEKYFNSATNTKGIFMTYSELNFILAEAREKGYISKSTPQDYYNTAVTASFNQWGVNMPANFLTTIAPYNNTTEVLYEQKWLALYHSGVESWFDWKRTKKPSFIKAGSGNINGNKVPVRLIYPSLEGSVNKTNYQAASSAMGGDTINASSWWW